MLELADQCSPEEIDHLKKTLPNPDELTGDNSWVDDGLKHGLKTCKVIHDGKPCCILLYHVNYMNHLVVNGAVSTAGYDSFSAIMTGVHKLAVSLKVNRIDFETRRPGLIRKAKQFGFTICGVGLIKQITPNG